jgi:hypothetical protein
MGESPMSIFQRLYDSEINFEVSGFYDAGFGVRLGDHLNGFLTEGKVETRPGCANKPWRISRTANSHRMSYARRRPTRPIRGSG